MSLDLSQVSVIRVMYSGRGAASCHDDHGRLATEDCDRLVAAAPRRRQDRNCTVILLIPVETYLLMKFLIT